MDNNTVFWFVEFILRELFYSMVAMLD
jgi:hypothetical protein